jgi:hypothetical protein
MNNKKPQFYPCFSCDQCCFKSANKKDFGRHLLTLKHKKNLSIITINNKITPKTPDDKITEFKCECGKQYKFASGLSAHKKNCNNKKSSLTKITNMLVRENKELKEMMAEQNKVILELAQKQTQTINNNTINNTKFNLNVFLNEQCKDAINIMDFVNSLKLQLNDLENIGSLGYAEGIGKVFIQGLRELDVYKRPIHCSDLKREILYIKDKDSWEKENDEKTKLKQAIKFIEHKNIKNIPEWINKHPDSKFSDSPKNDQYMKIISNSMGGSTNEEDEKNFNKIIKKVASEVIIEKPS